MSNCSTYDTLRTIVHQTLSEQSSAFQPSAVQVESVISPTQGCTTQFSWCAKKFLHVRGPKLIGFYTFEDAFTY
jgi:hypothetical protein